MTTTVVGATNGASTRPSFRYVHNVYFQDGLVLTGILVGLLFLTVAASLDAAGYVARFGLLIPVTLGAMVMSLLMAYSRFDSFFAFSHGMFTGLAWILYLMAGLVTAEESRSFVEYGFPELQANVYFVLYRLLNWTQMALGRQATADNYMFIFEICFLVWWLTYLGVWSIFRHGYTWRAIIPAGTVLLINTYYAPQSIIAFLVFFAFIALILLVRTNLAEQQARWRARSTYFSQDITLDFMRTGFTYSLLVLALAWIAPGLGRSAPVRDLLRPINVAYENVNAQLNDLYPEVARQFRPTTAAFGNTLSLGGERNVGEELIFTVAAPRARYWRAVVFDSFDGRQWQNTGEAEQNFANETPLPVANWLMREPITQTITLKALTGDVVFGAPDMLISDLPLDAKIRPVSGTRLFPAEDGAAAEDAVPVEMTYVRSRRTLEVESTYSLVSYQTVVTERALRDAGTDYPTPVIETYLTLPEDFSPEVAALARTVISETGAIGTEDASGLSVFDQAKAIERYLRTIPYNDEISAPPPDMDPLEYFLFEIREGYCDYYASAMATMLRSLGIPARTASGYAEGTFDEELNLYLVSAKDAHTWVEVYFPNYGWIEFEPTAGESILNRPSGADAAADDAAANNSPADFPEQTEPPLMEEDLPLDPGFGGELPEDFGWGNDGGGTGAWPWWVWALLTPPLLLLGLWGLRYTPVLGATAFTTDFPSLFYDRLQHWTQRLGIRLPETETPYEQGQRLSQIFPEGRTSIRQIIHAYVLYRFRPASLSSAGAAADGQPTDPSLSRVWKQLEPIFWKAWLRKFYTTVIRRRSHPFALHESTRRKQR